MNKARDGEVSGWHWHWPDHMQTICNLVQTNNRANISLLSSYGSDDLPDAQPDRFNRIEANQSTEGNRPTLYQYHIANQILQWYTEQIKKGKTEQKNENKNKVKKGK